MFTFWTWNILYCLNRLLYSLIFTLFIIFIQSYSRPLCLEAGTWEDWGSATPSPFQFECSTVAIKYVRLEIYKGRIAAPAAASNSVFINKSSWKYWHRALPFKYPQFWEVFGVEVARSLSSSWQPSCRASQTLFMSHAITLNLAPARVRVSILGLTESRKLSVVRFSSYPQIQWWGLLSSWFNNVYCVHDIRRGGLHCIIFKLSWRVYLVLVFRSGRSDKFLLNPEIRSRKCLRLLRYQSYPVAPGQGWGRLRRGSWCSFKSVTLPPDNADTATGGPSIRVAHFL